MTTRCLVCGLTQDSVLHSVGVPDAAYAAHEFQPVASPPIPTTPAPRQLTRADVEFSYTTREPARPAAPLGGEPELLTLAKGLFPELGGAASYKEFRAACDNLKAYLLASPPSGAPETAPLDPSVEAICAEIQRRAHGVPMGAAFHGGGMHDAAIYDAHLYAIKLVREAATSLAGHPAEAPGGNYETLKAAVHTYIDAWRDRDELDCIEGEPAPLELRQRLSREKARALHNMGVLAGRFPPLGSITEVKDG